MRVLLAEEHVTIRKKLRSMLEKLNYDIVCETDNGLKTYNKYLEYQPDIIFMSLTLPLLDGINTLLRIKKINPESCIVIMSEKSQKKVVFSAFENGADHYIIKPVELEKLKQVLDELGIMKDGANYV